MWGVGRLERRGEMACRSNHRSADAQRTHEIKLQLALWSRTYTRSVLPLTARGQRAATRLHHQPQLAVTRGTAVRAQTEYAQQASGENAAHRTASRHIPSSDRHIYIESCSARARARVCMYVCKCACVSQSRLHENSVESTEKRKLDMCICFPLYGVTDIQSDNINLLLIKKKEKKKKCI